MTKARERYLLTMIYLLSQEVISLRSVLYEYDGDKSEYLQMNRAELIREVIEHLEAEL
jgi:hypothetical protein